MPKSQSEDEAEPLLRSSEKEATDRFGIGRKVLRIARREYRAAVRTKGFVVGLLLGPLLMGGSAVLFALLKDRVDVSDKRLAVIDHSGLVAEAMLHAAEGRNINEVSDQESGKQVKPKYVIEIVEPYSSEPDRQRLELSNQVRNGKLHAFLEIEEGILHPRQNQGKARIAYYSKNPALDDMREWVAWPINGELRRLRLAELSRDIPRSVSEELFYWIGAEPLGLVSADSDTGQIKQAERHNRLEAILVPLIMPMIMFLLFMMGAVPHLNSVMEEKSQRIAEVMLGSIGPFPFMLGKLIGGACVSLTAAAVYIVGGVLTLHSMDFGESIPYHLFPWFVTYLVMAIFMFGAMFAALGSTCNDPTEAQSVSFLAMLPMLFPFFVQMPVVIHPQSGFATGLSLFPIFTPMLMLIRQGTPGGVPVWQPWLGLLGVAVTTLFFVWVGSRIFRVGILMQGTPPKLSNLIRWAVRG